jgi:transposase InsO family protein
MANRAPLTAAEKQYIQTRKQAGITLTCIAAELHCAYATARKSWRQLRSGQVPAPRGRPRRGVLSTFPEALVARAIELKRAHPHWGPANVRLELAHDPAYASVRLPSLARLAALFRSQCPEAVQARRHSAYPERPPAPATRAHQRWQVDAKEKVVAAPGEWASVLSVRDPASALMLASRAVQTTTPHGWRKLTRAEVQAILCQTFTRYGLPLELQTDHEVVYTGAAQADFPSLFTLWLTGLGITHVTSRNRRPTDQAQIERGHRTLGDMVWNDVCADSLAQLQQQLDQSRQRYNQHLPVQAAHCLGRPPLLAYPLAQHSGRPFRAELEWCLFDLQRVDQYLASQVWIRQISQSGSVSLADHLYYLGRALPQQKVAVRFNPVQRSFSFQAVDGRLLAELPSVGLTQADLIGYARPSKPPAVSWQLPLPFVGV